VDWLELCRINTGHIVDGWQSFRQSSDRIKIQSEKIARKLEAEGVACRDAYPSPVWVVGEITGKAELLQSRFRHIQLIPEVAQLDRRTLIRDLTFFLENSGGRYVRYAVATSGERVPWFGDLKGRRKQFHDNLRRATCEAGRLWGVEFLFRGDEYTFSEDGVHFHVNLVYRPTRRLSSPDWCDFLSWFRSRIGGVHWQDCGRLRDPNEVVKYVCKLGSEGQSIGLEDLSSSRLKWLYDETYRSKVSQPLGCFAVFRREMKQAGEAIKRVHQGKLVRVSKPRKEARQDRRTAGNRGKLENVILSRLLPSARFSEVMEPVTLVMGYTPEPSTGVGRIGLDILEKRKEQAKRWEAFNVHTCTTTVQEEKGRANPSCLLSKQFNDAQGRTERERAQSGSAVGWRSHLAEPETLPVSDPDDVSWLFS